MQPVRRAHARVRASAVGATRAGACVLTHTKVVRGDEEELDYEIKCELHAQAEITEAVKQAEEALDTPADLEDRAAHR